MTQSNQGVKLVQMTEATPGRTENGLIHVESHNERIERTQDEFDALVQKFLKRAPNTKGDGMRLSTGYNGEFPTHKKATFTLEESTIAVEYRVDLGTPPNSRISISTPIVVDNLPDNRDPHHPNDPLEYAEFKSEPYYGSLDISVGALTRPGDFGRPILLDTYTAGGLLPAIQTEGKGKLDSFNDVVSRLKDVTPQNPQYERPIERVGVR